MTEKQASESSEPCTEGKLLALFTVIVGLSRALVKSGNLDRDLLHAELDNGLGWLRRHDPHACQAFEDLLPMLRDI